MNANELRVVYTGCGKREEELRAAVLVFEFWNMCGA